MAGRVADEHHAGCLERWAPGCVVEMRRAARELGYALTTHGTMSYDIDVVAIPWIDDAKPVDELIPALRAACSKITGLPTFLACFPDIPEEWHLQDEEAIQMGVPVFSDKPHGRRAYAWQLGGGAYVDCSVMPRVER